MSDRIIAENDEWVISQNSMTEQADRELHTPDRFGMSFERFHSAVAYNKIDGKREYIILNERNEVIYATTVANDMFYYIEMCKCAKRYEFDLIQIAETGNVPKSV